MKKNLSLIAYVSMGIALLNMIFVIAFVKKVYEKLPNNCHMESLVYIFIVGAVLFLVAIGIVGLVFLIKNTTKSAFVASIILITLGVLLITTIYSFTWIFGSINAICGVFMIVVGAIHLKSTREYL
ncbi:hypothetical protein [Spiroplasma endosymbiont of Diplazon laetatorius]|uniref:hypothetical protein n=1 Tax=Spiroplasma endosymbiont of Diplazon laetatorius TaxID=3066322 RepID=UPI0030D1ECCA